MTSTGARKPPVVVGVATAALLVLLGLVGCTTSSDDPSPGTTASPGTTGAAPSSSTTHAPGPTTTTAGATTTTTTTASDRCRASELAGSLGAPSPGAGQLYVPLVVRNTGSRACTLTGYPGVSLLDGGGTEIGSPATRDTAQAPTTVDVPPGASASTTIHTVNAGISEAPCWAPSAEVEVYPPDDTDALVLAGAVTVCGDTFTVGPFVAGEAGG